MKSIVFILALSFTMTSWQEDRSISMDVIPGMSQELIGAWQAKMQDPVGGEVRVVTIVAEGYVSTTYYSLANKKFISTEGGAWSASGNTITKTIEYNTATPSAVGSTKSATFSLTGNTLKIDGDDKTWTRIDYGTPGALAGAYLITGRKRNGEISRRTPGARKTMKILSGTRFQWIAYNTDTGEFFGSGGGTYTTADGKYVENIDFFSRDGSRVGASLDFEYEFDLAKGEWHHSGLSSKGDPIYEIWTVRSMLDKK